MWGDARHLQLSGVSTAIFSHLRNAKTRNTSAIDRLPPSRKFFGAKLISYTGVFERQHPAIYRGQDLRFAARDPIGRAGRWQIVHCKRDQRSGDRCRPRLEFEHRELSIRAANAALCAPHPETALVRLTKAFERAANAANRSPLRRRKSSTMRRISARRPPAGMRVALARVRSGRFESVPAIFAPKAH